MKPLYVIVHEESVYNTSIPYPNQDVVIAEIERIKREEDHTFADISDSIPHGLYPQRLGLYPQRPILVCGAYYSGFHKGKSNKLECVDRQLQALLNRGFNASVHNLGTLTSALNSDFSLSALLHNIIQQSIVK